METDRKQPLEVFYSYAHEDEALRQELEKHLHLLELQGLIRGWHDRNINAGIEWASEIDAHLNSAHIILLLVSPDFLSSHYCYSIEMRHAMERHYARDAYVIPIILRPIYWQGTPFDKLQVLPTDAKPVTSWLNLDEAFLNVAIGIRKVIERFPLFSPANPISTGNKTTSHYIKDKWRQELLIHPYRGLQVFYEQDAPFFFGRDTFTEHLVESVRKHPFIAVVGPSGSGKSSLVRAGLLPRLRYEGRWQITTFRPSERPFHALASALIALLEPQLGEIDRLIHINKLAEPLQQGEISLYDVIERVVDKQGGQLLFLIDQFEELYTRCQRKEDRQRFLDLLVETIHLVSQSQSRNATVVITLRADFLGQALLYRPFADTLQFTDVKISPMSRQELHDAIIRPAKMFGVDIESGLAERIIEEVHHEPGNLPLLEFTLEALWTKQSNKTLTHAAYQELGGVRDAIADYAEYVFEMLNGDEQQQAQQIFIQLVHPGDGTEDARRIATRYEVGEKNWKLVVHLSSTRLVICGRDETTGEETVEIIHEALIQRWRRLREWVNEYRDFRLWQDRLRIFLLQWEKNNKDVDDLLRGTFLAESVQWMDRYPDLLNSSEQALIEVSDQYQRQEILHKEELLKLQELESFKDQYFITVSHELSTPLTAIQGYIELLTQFDEMLPSDQRLDFLQKARRGCEEFVVMLRNLMDMGWLEVGISDTLNTEKKRVSIQESVKSVINLIEPALTGEQRELHTSILPELFVFADPIRLRQVLMHLAINALKYSPQGTPISISTHMIGDLDHHVSICIADQGAGIPPHLQTKLFQRFFRLERDVDSPVRGSGLGLYVSHHLIEAMGGTIQVESSGVPGEGSSFSITLPLCEDE